jgi:hypothetical protein
LYRRHAIDPARPEGLTVQGEAGDQLSIVGEIDHSPIGVKLGIGRSQRDQVMLFVVIEDRKNVRVSEAQTMLAYSIRLLVHYLKFQEVPLPS